MSIGCVVNSVVRAKSRKDPPNRATTKDMFGQMLDKITDQAVEIARQQTARNRAEKLANEWEQRALRAEQKLADQMDWQVSSQNNFEAYKVEQCKADLGRNLLERVQKYHDGLFSLTPDTGRLY